MHSKSNEQALGAAIEKLLTGACLEDIKKQGLSVNSVNEDAEIYRTRKRF